MQCVFDVCVCPWERVIKGTVHWRDFLKGVRKEVSGRQLRGQRAELGGGLMQVPNSTSALGVEYFIHLGSAEDCWGM